ncbi:hypothetical protein BDD12DRAFT_239419 [Trichophaea hybrida]|nr:hypothetical protein BDD12DRAFT_239419 [Trichophaea hybrida]
MDFSNGSSSQQNPPPTDMRHSPAHPFYAAIVLYPFLAGLATHLDRTDLHNLASTCHHFHSTLSDYRRTILSLSLRCQYPQRTQSSSETIESWRHIRSDKRCARDLVQRCVRCTSPTCRNCIQKPNPAHVNSRIRRLCKPCQNDPFLVPSEDLPTYESLARICSCATNSWLCPACAKELASEDNAYRIQCEYWTDNFLRCRRSLVRGEDGRFSYAPTGYNWGPVCCARGREECVGLRQDMEAEIEVEVVTVTEDDGGWDSLAAAFEADGDERLEDHDLETKIPRRKRRSGKEVEWDGRGWAFLDEWQGKARGYCNWCDRVVLSKEDRIKAGLD